MQLTPIIAIHMTAALGAIALGPVALWARKGATQRPKLHRAFGYAWVTLMLVTAISALFIRGGRLPNIAGYSPIHLLVPVTLFGLFGSFWFLARGNIRGHRRVMQGLYFGACVVAGAFTLLPGRFLGDLIWVEWLGLARPSCSSRTYPRTFHDCPNPLQHAPLGLGPARRIAGPGLQPGCAAAPPACRASSLMPLGMAAFSLWGTISAFGGIGCGAGEAGSPLASCCCSSSHRSRMARRRAATTAPPVSFALPGSWMPMALILGIFLTKYAVGVELAMQPDLVPNAQLHAGDRHALRRLQRHLRRPRRAPVAPGPATRRQPRRRVLNACKENTMNDDNPQDRKLERLARKRAGAKMGWYIHATVYIAVNLLLAMLSAMSGRNWAVFPAFGWGIGLAVHGVVVFLVPAAPACTSGWCSRNATASHCSAIRGEAAQHHDAIPARLLRWPWPPRAPRPASA